MHSPLLHDAIETYHALVRAADQLHPAGKTLIDDDPIAPAAASTQMPSEWSCAEVDGVEGQTLHHLLRHDAHESTIRAEHTLGRSSYHFTDSTHNIHAHLVYYVEQQFTHVRLSNEHWQYTEFPVSLTSEAYTGGADDRCSVWQQWIGNYHAYRIQVIMTRPHWKDTHWVQYKGVLWDRRVKNQDSCALQVQMVHADDGIASVWQQQCDPAVNDAIKDWFWHAMYVLSGERAVLEPNIDYTCSHWHRLHEDEAELNGDDDDLHCMEVDCFDWPGWCQWIVHRNHLYVIQRTHDLHRMHTLELDACYDSELQCVEQRTCMKFHDQCVYRRIQRGPSVRKQIYDARGQHQEVIFDGEYRYMREHDEAFVHIYTRPDLWQLPEVSMLTRDQRVHPAVLPYAALLDHAPHAYILHDVALEATENMCAWSCGEVELVHVRRCQIHISRFPLLRCTPAELCANTNGLFRMRHEYIRSPHHDEDPEYPAIDNSFKHACGVDELVHHFFNRYSLHTRVRELARCIRVAQLEARFGCVNVRTLNWDILVDAPPKHRCHVVYNEFRYVNADTITPHLGTSDESLATPRLVTLQHSQYQHGIHQRGDSASDYMLPISEQYDQEAGIVDLAPLLSWYQESVSHSMDQTLVYRNNGQRLVSCLRQWFDPSSARDAVRIEVAEFVAYDDADSNCVLFHLMMRKDGNTPNLVFHYLHPRHNPTELSVSMLASLFSAPFADDRSLCDTTNTPGSMLMYLMNCSVRRSVASRHITYLFQSALAMLRTRVQDAAISLVPSFICDSYYELRQEVPTLHSYAKLILTCDRAPVAVHRTEAQGLECAPAPEHRQTVHLRRNGETGTSQGGATSSVHQTSEYYRHYHDSTVDEESRVSTSTAVQTPPQRGITWGYKLARTEQHRPCVVRLRIPAHAQVVLGERGDKYRCSHAHIEWIREVTFVYSDADTVRAVCYTHPPSSEKLCTVCHERWCNEMAYPCKHKLCSLCWSAHRESSSTCPLCRQDVERFFELKMMDNDEDFSLTHAYSCISRDDEAMRYDRYTDVHVSDFDSDITKHCANGIHYFVSEASCALYHEHFNIPEVGAALPLGADDVKEQP